MGTLSVVICRRHPYADQVAARLIEEGHRVFGGVGCVDPTLRLELRQRMPDRLVVAACPDPHCGPLIEEASERAGVPAWACSLVLPPADRPESPERTATRLLARVRRLEATPAVAPERTVAWYGMRRPVSTRRGLFARSTWLMQEAAPCIESTHCRARFGCRSCAEACPHHAIQFHGGSATIDVERCTGCGLCVDTCWLDAITHAPTDAAGVDAELQVLLQGAPHPRLIALRCRSYRKPLPDGYLDVPLPCATATSTIHVLDALRHGADGVAILADAGSCPHPHRRPRLDQRVGAWRMLLKALDLEPSRITLAGCKEDLRTFADTVTALPARGAGNGALRSTGERVALQTRLAAMAQTASPSSGVLYHDQAPLALVDCDPGRCTLCGVCANVCPTGAVQWLHTEDRVALRFDHAVCPGCRRCEEICPEHAIRVTRGIAPDLLQGPATLAEDTMVRCRVCGVGIAPHRLAHKVEAGLAAQTSRAKMLAFDLCPDCRLARMLQETARR